MKEELWLHVPTFTLAVVTGDFGEFYLNRRREKTYWGIFRAEAERGHSNWAYVCDV